MSTFVKHQSPKPKGVKLALFLGAVWLILLLVMWFAYRNSEGNGGGFLNFVGRFHILIVHLPIGVIFLALIMDVLSRLTAFSHLARSLPFIHWIAFIGAIGATLVGYLLMSVEGFAGRAMDLHLYFGLGVVVTTFFALFFSLRNQAFLSTLSVFAAVGTAMASGHFGGAMVHEGDYLVEHAPEPLKPFLLLGLESHSDAATLAKADPAGKEAEVAEIPLGEQPVYANFVVPMLEAKCNECHNENKVKGKLRMDTLDLLLAGAEGSDFPTIVPGDAEQSEMIVRVTLPSDHDEFMPTKGEPLTPEEIQLLSLWIKAGATPELKIADLGEDPSIEATALAVKAGQVVPEEVAESEAAGYVSVWDTLSPEEQDARMEEVNIAAAKYHFSVMPISAEDDRLRINVINAAKEFGDDQLALLEPIADRIVWLDLARSQVTDAGMKTVGRMKGLERLHLENTTVGDEGIAHLKSLSQLEYLNLYGTQVGNGIFETLETLPKLKKLYVWQTQVDPGAARSFERSVNLEINTGVELAAVAPVAEAPAEPAPEAAKPAPAAAKPAAETKPTPPASPATPVAKPEAKPAPKVEAPKPAAKTPPPATPAPATPKKETPATPAPAKPAPDKPAAAATADKTPEKKAASATPAKPVTAPSAPAPEADLPPVKKPETAPPAKADTPPVPEKAPQAAPKPAPKAE